MYLAEQKALVRNYLKMPFLSGIIINYVIILIARRKALMNMHKKGFSFIELLIVIVIMSILVISSVPKMSAQIEAIRAAEALLILGTIKRQAEQCYNDSNKQINNCRTFFELGIIPPENGSLFKYKSSIISPDILHISAVRIDKRNNTNTIDKQAICLEFNAKTEEILLGVNTPKSPYANIIKLLGVNGSLKGCTPDFGFSPMDALINAPK